MSSNAHASSGAALLTQRSDPRHPVVLFDLQAADLQATDLEVAYLQLADYGSSDGKSPNRHGADGQGAKRRRTNSQGAGTERPNLTLIKFDLLWRSSR
jgi:hypothetical protein